MQFQIDANAYAQSLGNSSRSFALFVNSCQVQTTVCFGVGCPGSGGTRSTGASFSRLGTSTSATIELRPLMSGASSKTWSNVNLNVCGQTVTYP